MIGLPGLGGVVQGVYSLNNLSSSVFCCFSNMLSSAQVEIKINLSEPDLLLLFLVVS